MKVRATITVDYKIDPLHYTHCGKDIILAIEKKEFCNRKAVSDLLSNGDVKITVEEVKE